MFSVPQGIYDPALIAVFAALVVGFAGVPGLFLQKLGRGQMVATLITLPAALFGLLAALTLFFHRSTTVFDLGWRLPFGPCTLSIDPLSAFFLIPIFLVAGLGALFSLGYWPAKQNASTERGLTFFWGILAASMAILVMARNGVFFIIAWEMMALSAYFLLMTEHEKRETRHAGAFYLIATHVGTVALFVFFSLLASESGSFLFPAAGSLSPLTPVALAMALLAFVGFGAKAGIVPLHIWLPAAHANAPSHVSAMLSGVMLKMGLYGIFRTLTFFHEPPLAWGVFLITAGIVTALLGILFAVVQRDLKKLLAYSSIENIGIITTGLGMAVLGAATHNHFLTYVGLTGAFLHILNHSFFKPLLFLGSGVIIHATGTREMNKMGGLAKVMPKATLLFLVGSIAICGLPPLNGFISEFLLYVGFFSERGTSTLFPLMFLAPVLALVGGLAVFAFTKMLSAVFLGVSRDPSETHSHEARSTMLIPMSVFALFCIVIGFLSPWALRFVSPLTDLFMPADAVGAPQNICATMLGNISLFGLLIGLTILVVGAIWQVCVRRGGKENAPTWGCGFLRPTAQMQYTATSFSQLPVSVFNGVIRQKIQRPLVFGVFPGATQCSDRPTETILTRIVLPTFKVLGVSFAFLRRLQHGHMHIYMLYIFATLFVLLFWAH